MCDEKLEERPKRDCPRGGKQIGTSRRLGGRYLGRYSMRLAYARMGIFRLSFSAAQATGIQGLKAWMSSSAKRVSPIKVTNRAADRIKEMLIAYLEGETESSKLIALKAIASYLVQKNSLE